MVAIVFLFRKMSTESDQAQIERLGSTADLDSAPYAEMILAKKQSNGLIYDADVSPTVLRHRMKAEVTMSAVMSAEILSAAHRLDEDLRIELVTSLVDPKRVPLLGYMTAEQFRLAALRVLGHAELFPTGIGEHISACAEGLEVGWCDFSVRSKVDAYMGTAKRTSRDMPIHSPLVACHVAVLAETLEPAQQAAVAARVSEYGSALSKDPLAIPAFQMRDIPIPFGVDITPIEAICASWLIAKAS